MTNGMTPEIKIRRKEIKAEAKKHLVGKALCHPSFPYDIYINMAGIKEWINDYLVHSISDNLGNIDKGQDL